MAASVPASALRTSEESGVVRGRAGMGQRYHRRRARLRNLTDAQSETTAVSVMAVQSAPTALGAVLFTLWPTTWTPRVANPARSARKPWTAGAMPFWRAALAAAIRARIAFAAASVVAANTRIVSTPRGGE